MHKTRAFPPRKFGEAWGGNEERNGGKTKEGTRGGSDAVVQGTASFERVSIKPPKQTLSINNFLPSRSSWPSIFVHVFRDPIPLPEKERKPLTQIQEINLHVEHRAVDRAEFDKKIKEKEMMYKRYREEAEAARQVNVIWDDITQGFRSSGEALLTFFSLIFQMEDEKALKQLRRTLVPHARPVPNFANPFVPQKYDTSVYFPAKL